MTEEDQLENIRSGDANALKEIYLRYQPEFIAWVTKTSGLKHEDASEVYHLTMLAFYENVKGGKLTELSSQLKTYIFGIGKNKAKEFKRLYRAKSVSLDAMNLDYAAEESIEVEDKSELIKLMQKGLQSLGEPCNSLLEAFYLDEMSMEEISKSFNYKSSSVAKTQKYKCIQRLKKFVAKQ